MRRVLLILFATVCSVLSNNLWSQSANLFDTLDNMTMEEIKALLEKEVKSMDGLISLGNINFILAPAVVTTNDSRSTEHYPLYSGDEIKTGINKLLDELYFIQYRNNKSSKVEFEISASKIKEYLPKYTLADYYAIINKLYLADGKILNVNDTVRDDQTSKYDTTKRIDSIEVSICHYYPTDLMRIELSPEQNEHKQGNSILRLTEMDESSAYFIATGDFVKNIVSVIATSSGGKTIKSISSNSLTLHNIKAFEMAGEMKPLFTGIISKIDAGTLTTSRDVKKELSQIAEKYSGETMEPQSLTKAYAGFAENIRNICLTAYSRRDSVVKTMIMPNGKVKYLLDSLDIVTDGNDKDGLMDKYGNWVIEPRFDYLKHIKGPYYKNKDVDEDKDEYYLLDKEKKQMIPVDFGKILQFYDNGKLYRIKAKTGYYNNYGIVDDKGNYIIPAIYDKIDYFREEGLFAVKREVIDSLSNKIEHSGGLYSKDGTQVLSEKYVVQNIKDGFIYGLLHDTIPAPYFVINKDKQQILKYGWCYKYSFSEGYLLVVDSQVLERFYIDESGNTVIPSDEKRRYESPIINGCTEFFNKDTKLYGYIDNKGSEIIPPMYSHAEPFYSENVAYVQKAGKAFFIDKKNKVIKELNSLIRNRYKVNIGEPVSKVRLTLENGDVYDAYGNLIIEDKE